MNKLKHIIIILLMATLFLTIFTQRDYLTDLHRDGWIVINRADKFLGEEKITFTSPYTRERNLYPPGSFVFSAVISSITGLELTRVAWLFPAINFVLLGLMIFVLARWLFRDDWVAIACIAFTPLIFNNVTIMGHFYYVPLAFGVTLSLLFFNFYLKQKWFLALLTFLILSITHSSTIIFTSIAAGIYLIFNRKYWKKIPLFTLLAVILFTALKLTRNVDVTEETVSFIQWVTSLTKHPPFISVYLTLSIIFLVFIAFGFLFMVMREKRARSFLVPIFAFLALDLFMYWNFHGFFIVYRRLIYYVLLFLPFLAGYGIYSLSYVLTHLFSHVRKPLYRFISRHQIILLFMLLLFVPAAVKIHMGSHPMYTLVNLEEQELFTKFSQQHPGAYLATNHLQAFGLPYYDLKPLQLPPDAGKLYLDQLMPCFMHRDLSCMVNFFSQHNYSYLYTQTLVNSASFEPELEHQGMVIYRFVGNRTNSSDN